MNHAKTISATLPDQHEWSVPTILAGSIFTIIFFLLMAVSVSAQTPAPQQSQPVALTGGTIYTVSDGVIENGTIIFEDGVITAIGLYLKMA